MPRYRQLTKDIGASVRCVLLLERVRAALRPGDRLVFDALVDPPKHDNERQLARLCGEPYRTFKVKKARILVVVKKHMR